VTVEPRTTLLDALHDALGVTGANVSGIRGRAAEGGRH
jgi:hypothetical protein